MTYVQRAPAFSIDFSGLPRLGDDQGLNFFGIKGDKGDTGAQWPAGAQGEQGLAGIQDEQGAPGEGVKFGHLIVFKHVIKSGGPNPAKASDYIIHIDGNNQSPNTFPSSEDGTDVTIGFGSYSVSEEIGPQVHFSSSTHFSEQINTSILLIKSSYNIS